MFKNAVLALAMAGLIGSVGTTEAEAGNRTVVRRPVVRALVEANRNATTQPRFVTPVPTWGYRYQPPSYGWSYRPDSGWGFYQSGGTWGWGFGY